MGQLFRWVVEPGFVSSHPVHVALAVGAVVAAVSGVVGVFTVIRGQSFAGHALTDVASAGGSGAVLAGASPVLGFVGASMVGAAAMDVIGVRRAGERDLATGVVLGAATGLAALFFHLTDTTTATTGAAQQVLFGSIFTTSGGTVVVVVAFAVVALGVLAAIYRPLLLSSVAAEVAVARGVAVRLVGVLFLLALAVSVGLSSLAVGSILSTALLIAPAATALRFTRRLGSAIAVACSVGVGGTWVGVLLTYDSYYWSRSHRSVPASFLIVAVLLAAYLASLRAGPGRQGRQGRPRWRSGQGWPGRRAEGTGTGTG